MSKPKAKPGQNGRSTAAAKPRDLPKLDYALSAYVAERRDDGWWIARQWHASVGEKPKWQGPFVTPQDTCVAIARLLCAELSNRHASRAAYYHIGTGNPLYGLPKPPVLAATRK